MTTAEKIAHNQQVEQERAAYHERRCEESDAYERVYERVMNIAKSGAIQSEGIVNAIQIANQKVAFQDNEDTRKIMARQRKGIESVESACIPDGLVKCYFDMLFTENISEDLQALKEISEAEQAFNSKLELFDKYEL